MDQNILQVFELNDAFNILLVYYDIRPACIVSTLIDEQRSIISICDRISSCSYDECIIRNNLQREEFAPSAAKGIDYQIDIGKYLGYPCISRTWRMFPYIVVFYVSRIESHVEYYLMGIRCNMEDIDKCKDMAESFRDLASKYNLYIRLSIRRKLE